MKSYLEIFSSSPFHPLQKHMDKVLSCAQLMQPFIDAAIAQDPGQLETLYQQIGEQERRADRYKREVMTRLPRGIFTPVARGDLITMLNLQDGVASKVEDIACRLSSRPVKLPPQAGDELAQILRDYVAHTIKVTEQAHKAVHELDELITTGFSGREAELVNNMLDEVEQGELRSRRLLHEVRSAIYRAENELPPVEAIYLYRVVDRLAELHQALRQHGNQFQMMLAIA